MERSDINRFLRSLALAAGVGWLAPGCATYREQQQAEALQQQTDLRIVQEKLQQLTERIDGIMAENERLGLELERMRKAQEGAGQTQLRTMQGQIDTISQRVNEVSAARERDRQAILDDVSKKVAELLRRSAPSGGGTTGGSGRGSAKKSEYGYEHEVKPGETLSAIAAAYGVKASAIAEGNNLKDQTIIRVGQKLFIPER